MAEFITETYIDILILKLIKKAYREGYADGELSDDWVHSAETDWMCSKIKKELNEILNQDVGGLKDG